MRDAMRDAMRGSMRGLRGGREGVEPLPPHPEAPFYKGVSEDLEGLGVFS